ncbi:MAG TPA: Vms1/Ankzf1 family peptidyl-tRNA hydrolase [Candidatus Hydrogenedentes bacterium]|nr:Vms1/Ankzf1 family peptidyl-tRNA hydrolase [Candidatus Hydrogenedentota bacterium]
MITHDELQTLIHHAAKEGHNMLSVYLNVDQARAANLNRQFEVPLHNMLRGIEGVAGDVSERGDFEKCAVRVRQYVAEYHPSGRTLALFADPSQDFFWARDFRMSIENHARWLPRPFIRPFLEARNRHPRYVVALTDRGKTRLLTVYMGEIEEEKGLVAEEDVKHFDASGKDQTRSQMRFQRNAQEHAKHHLKNVVGALKDLDKSTQFDRLILGGPSRAVADLERLLSEPLKHRVVSTVTLPVEADRRTVLDETLRVDEDYECRSEMALTEELLTAAAKSHLAAIGLPATVKATVEGRVRMLVYPRDFMVLAKECPTLPANGGGAKLTDFFGKPIRPDENVLDLLVESTAREGGKVEVLHGEAGNRLKEEGAGIGAFLRY